MGEKVSVACPFIGAGKTAGVAVWKIDNLEPVKLKDTEKGYFCTGASMSLTASSENFTEL